MLRARLTFVALVVAILALASSIGRAAGTVTVSEETFGAIKKIAFTWTSDGSGNADGTTTAAFNGTIERLVTVPAAAGSAPTDNYDITIADQDGTDVLMGGGANRDTANTEQVLASSLGVVANDTLTIHVTNAGSAKGGVVYLYVR